MTPSHQKYSVLVALVSCALVGSAFLGGVVATIALHARGARLAQGEPFPAPLTLAPERLTARSAIVYDPVTGSVLFAKEAKAQLPLASLTKLMTAAVVLANRPADTLVTITGEDLKPEGDWGLRPGDIVPLRELLTLALIASSNDAMAAAAASLGEDRYLLNMNQAAQALGLTETYFLNPTGLDVDEETAGAYSTAQDVARLSALFYKTYPSYFELTTKNSISIRVGTRTLAAKATALPLISIPGFIGAKTGYTDLAGGNVVALFDIEVGHPLVAVVLGSTEKGRFEDIRTLITAAQEAQMKP